MPRGRFPIVVAVIVALAATSSIWAEPVQLVEFQSHALNLTLDVPNHAVAISDKGVLAAQNGWNLLYLPALAENIEISLNVPAVDYPTKIVTDSSQLPGDLDIGHLETPALDKVTLVLFRSDNSQTIPFSFQYKAVFDQDPGAMHFSRERVGGEVTGTIVDRGAYLSGGSYFYPMGDEELASFELTADIPAGWESISDGNQTSSEVRDSRKIQSWSNPFKSDGCMFMAAPYVIKSTMVDSVAVWCYFFAADTGLFDQYLPATADYIKMYSDLIGPYPYQRFTVAENFFPTGYGMPAWTLLGQQVLQMPFIVKTSLGHEVLHNWWGNSVYVDYARGNWCEGLTVYGADYRYKLMESPEAARSYRKDILKQFVSYVDSDNDFPLRDFTSRTSPDTRSIGYGKAMMVFHMIEQEIGSKPFYDAWKLVYKRYIEQKIGWEEWIGAFEETSGKDLSYIIPQWIDRAGAPTIAIDRATVDETGGATTIALQLSQPEADLYTLQIPVRLSGPSSASDTSLVMPDSTDNYTLPDHGASSLAVDPDFHLFRHLYPAEVEPIVSSILGKDSREYFTPDSLNDVVGLFTEFAANMEGDSVKVGTMSEFADAEPGCAQIVLNPDALPEYLQGKVDLTNEVATIQGTDYPRDGHTLVLSGQNWAGHERCLVVITTDFASLPRLGQLVPHYGKYSYLVFQGTRNIGKGQWKVDSSPLKVVLK